LHRLGSKSIGSMKESPHTSFVAGWGGSTAGPSSRAGIDTGQRSLAGRCGASPARKARWGVRVDDRQGGPKNQHVRSLRHVELIGAMLFAER
jgi:hypothetical protein